MKIFVFSKKERGVALIMALLVVSVATVVGAGLLSIQHISVQRTERVSTSDQAWWFAAAMERYAAGVLETDFKEQTENIDEREEFWALPVVSPLDIGGISGNIKDAQGLFNINSLVGNDAQAAGIRFTDLLVISGVDQVTATALAQAATDWIDVDQQQLFPDGAEDDFYLSQNPPYRTANTLMTSPSELLLVKGFRERNNDGQRVFDLVAPHLAALPDPDIPLNVNTATAEVIAVQHNLIDEVLAVDLAREDLSDNPQSANEETASIPNLSSLLGNAAGNFKPAFPSVADFLSNIPVPQNENPPPAQLFSVNSQYFLVESQASVGNTGVSLYSLLHRQQDGTIRILSRSRDRW